MDSEVDTVTTILDIAKSYAQKRDWAMVQALCLDAKAEAGHILALEEIKEV